MIKPVPFLRYAQQGVTQIYPLLANRLHTFVFSFDYGEILTRKHKEVVGRAILILVHINADKQSE